MGGLRTLELPWRDPTAVARQLAARLGSEGLVLLEGDGSPLGRRAVLGVNPIETVCCRGLPGDPDATDPFAALAAMGRRGGPWLGWLAYEAGAWVEASAPWHRSDMATLWAVRHDPLLHFDLIERRCWLEGRDPERLRALAAELATLPLPPAEPPGHPSGLQTGSASEPRRGLAADPAARPLPLAEPPGHHSLPLAASDAEQQGGMPAESAAGPLFPVEPSGQPSGLRSGSASEPRRGLAADPAALPTPPAGAGATAATAPGSTSATAAATATVAGSTVAGSTIAGSTSATAAAATVGATATVAGSTATVADSTIAGPTIAGSTVAATADADGSARLEVDSGRAGIALGEGGDPAAEPRLRDAAGAAATRPPIRPRGPVPIPTAAQPLAPPIPLDAWRWHTTPQRYADQVELLLRRIAAGDLFQANLTACCEVELAAPPDPLALWQRLRRHCPAPFAGVAIAASGEAVISASPERFLRLHPDGVVETRPIKGTRPRSVDPEHDAAAAAALVCDPKDRAENVMIVDLLRNDLGRVCRPGSIAVPQLVALESYAQVHHLTSVVRGQLRPDRDLVALLRACWPGGSISGAPKVRACTRLHALEPVPRGPYCGSLFHWDGEGSFDSSILIRSVMLRGRRLRVHAGGGIVADSDPAAEAEEMGWKIRPLLEALA